MTRVSIASSKTAPLAAPTRGMSGDMETRALFAGPDHAIHAHLHRLPRGGEARVGPLAMDCIVYVWTGAVEAGGRQLGANSSLVVERGAEATIRTREGAQIATFHAAQPPPNPRAGGHVHLLPAERLQRGRSGGPGDVGAMHADAACPTCEIWMHEVAMAPRDETPEQAEDRIHAHNEDELIFVVEGEMRLGARVLGPGSALMVAADTFYGFKVGPEGLKVVNFRAALPTEIRFKRGGVLDEVAFWKPLGAPAYLEPVSS